MTQLRRIGLIPTLLLAAAVSYSPVLIAAGPEQAEAEKIEEKSTGEVSQDKAPVEEEIDNIKWISDLAEAQKIARAENKDLLLFFTGSDWCGYCMQVKKAVFSTPEFEEYLSTRYVPVLLDFPHGTKLPEQIVAQNEKLQGQFQVAGFPAVFMTDVGLLPYGNIGGFGGEEVYWKKLAAVGKCGDKMRAVKGSVEVAAITKPEVLEQIVELVPGGLLSLGWSDQIERMGASNVPGSEEFKTKWSEKLVAIQNAAREAEAIANAKSEMQRLWKANVPAPQMFEFLETGIADAQGHPERLSLFLSAKANYLGSKGEYEKSLAVLDQLLAMPEITGRQRASLEGGKVSTYLAMGRIDEGLSVIRKGAEERKYPSEEIRQASLLLVQADALVKAGQISLSAPYWRELLELPPMQSKEYFFACINAFEGFGSVGLETELRGRISEGMAKIPGIVPRMKNERALLAAICFRAVDKPDLAQDALTLIGPEDEVQLKGDPEQVRQGRQKLQGIKDEMTKAANGSKTDALCYLGQHSLHMGKVSYKFEAALELLKQNKVEEADQLAAQANKLMDALEPNQPDAVAKEHLQSLFKQWKTAREAVSK